MPCKRVGKIAEGGRNLAFRGLAFVTPDGSSRLLDASCNIMDVGQLVLPILVGWAPPFEETLEWLQSAYTAERIRSCVVPASTVLVPSTMSEGDSLFPAFWRHLLRRFPGAYAPTQTTHGPLGPDYLGYPEVILTQTMLAPLGSN